MHKGLQLTRIIRHCSRPANKTMMNKGLETNSRMLTKDIASQTHNCQLPLRGSREEKRQERIDLDLLTMQAP